MSFFSGLMTCQVLQLLVAERDEGNCSIKNATVYDLKHPPTLFPYFCEFLLPSNWAIRKKLLGVMHVTLHS